MRTIIIYAVAAAVCIMGISVSLIAYPSSQVDDNDVLHRIYILERSNNKLRNQVELMKKSIARLLAIRGFISVPQPSNTSPTNSSILTSSQQLQILRMLLTLPPQHKQELLQIIRQQLPIAGETLQDKIWRELEVREQVGDLFLQLQNRKN